MSCCGDLFYVFILPLVYLWGLWFVFLECGDQFFFKMLLYCWSLLSLFIFSDTASSCLKNQWNLSIMSPRDFGVLETSFLNNTLGRNEYVNAAMTMLSTLSSAFNVVFLNWKLKVSSDSSSCCCLPKMACASTMNFRCSMNWLKNSSCNWIADTLYKYTFL